MLELSRKENGDIGLVGRLDAAQADTLKNALDGIDADIRLDLSELEYISSAGLGVLIGTHSRLEKSGYRLCLLNPTKPVMTILKLSRLDQVLRIE